MNKWYALRVRSRHEKMVHAQLAARHEDAFLPLYCTRRRWADRWKNVSLPLFPGYIFCRFDVVRRHAVVATSGVIEIVKLGAEPAAIEDSQIEAVRLIVTSEAAAEPYPALVTGQRVSIAGGPLNGLCGTLAEIRDRLRVVVCVELLCRSVMVEVKREWLVPLAIPKPAPGALIFGASE